MDRVSRPRNRCVQLVEVAALDQLPLGIGEMFSAEFDQIVDVLNGVVSACPMVAHVLSCTALQDAALSPVRLSAESSSEPPGITRLLRSILWSADTLG